jgi:hypothetical protein
MNARQIVAVVGVACSVMTAGCGGDDEVVAVVPGVDTGTLLQTWAIAGSQDVRTCAQYGADRMRVVVYNDKGDVHATELSPCRDFQKRLTLRAQRYTGALTFVNVNGDPVSKTLPVPPFTISDDAVTPIHVDFPADAMRP